MAQSIHPKMQGMDLMMETLIGAARETIMRAAQAKAKAGSKNRPARPESPLWDELRTRAARQLVKRGEQSMLARYLGVSRQRVHQMIKSKAGQPNAERALLLLAWVAARERGQTLG